MIATPLETPQLHMAWPAARRHQHPTASLAPGYSVRTFRAGDERAFLGLMALSDFDP